MTSCTWYRRSVWNYKGNKEYTKSGYEAAKERFNPDELDVDCSDRHYVITGSNSGIGLEIAREIAKRGGVLHMVCRNYESAKEARSDLITNTGNDKIHIHTLDLAKPRDVMAWAEQFATSHERIHVLINNAGCMVHERYLDDDGIETNFAVNTLAPHIITMMMLPILQKNEDARVVTVSSAGMLTVRLDSLDLMHETMDPFNGRLVYSQNKRQQVIMTLWYAQRYDKVHFSVMHPGWADTPAVRNSLPQFYEMMKGNLRTSGEGADTAVWLAISKAALKYPSGFFFQDREPTSTHLPLAWTKTSIEEENLLMNKLMLLMQKISPPEKFSEETELIGDNGSILHANGVKAPFEANGTTPKISDLNTIVAPIPDMDLEKEVANEEDEVDRQTESHTPLSSEEENRSVKTEETAIIGDRDSVQNETSSVQEQEPIEQEDETDEPGKPANTLLGEEDQEEEKDIEITQEKEDAKSETQTSPVSEENEDSAPQGSPEPEEKQSTPGTPAPEEEAAAPGSPDPEDKESASGTPAPEGEASAPGSPAPEDRESASGSPAPEQEASVPGSPAPEDKESASGTPAPEGEASAPGSPAPEDRESASGTPAPEGEASAPGSPAPEDRESASATPAPEGEASASGSPAPEDRESASGTPAPEGEASVPGSPDPEDRESASGTPALEEEVSAPGSPAPEDKESASGTPAPEEEASAPGSPAPEDRESISGTPAPEEEASAPGSPAPEDKESVSGTPSPEEEASAPGSPAPEDRESVSGTPAPEEKESGSGSPAPEDKESAPGTPAPEEETSASGSPAPEDRESTSGTPAPEGEASVLGSPAPQEEELIPGTPAAQEEEPIPETPAPQEEESVPGTPAAQEEEPTPETPAPQEEEPAPETPGAQEEETPVQEEEKSTSGTLSLDERVTPISQNESAPSSPAPETNEGNSENVETASVDLNEHVPEVASERISDTPQPTIPGLVNIVNTSEMAESETSAVNHVSPTPSDRIHQNATTFVEHLIDITAEKAAAATSS